MKQQRFILFLKQHAPKLYAKDLCFVVLESFNADICVLLEFNINERYARGCGSCGG